MTLREFLGWHFKLFFRSFLPQQVQFLFVKIFKMKYKVFQITGNSQQQIQQSQHALHEPSGKYQIDGWLVLPSQQFGNDDDTSLWWTHRSGLQSHFSKSHVIHLDKQCLWRYSGKSTLLQAEEYPSVESNQLLVFDGKTNFWLAES